MAGFEPYTNPNLVNPGGSFLAGMQIGNQDLMQQRQLAQTKELTMAQMGQQRQEFDVTSAIEKQRLQQQGVLNMAQIGLMGTQQDLYKTQVNAATTLQGNLMSDKGTLADDYSKMHAMPITDLANYSGGSYITQDGRANFEQAKGQLLGTAQGQQVMALNNANTSAKTQMLTNQLDNINYANQFQIPVPMGPDGNIDYGSLNMAVVHDQTSRSLAIKQFTSEEAPEVLAAKIRMEGMQAIAGMRDQTSTANNQNTVAGRQYQADMNDIALRETKGAITEQQAEVEIATARQRRDSAGGAGNMQGLAPQAQQGAPQVPGVNPGAAAWGQNFNMGK